MRARPKQAAGGTRTHTGGRRRRGQYMYTRATQSATSHTSRLTTLRTRARLRPARLPKRRTALGCAFRSGRPARQTTAASPCVPAARCDWSSAAFCCTPSLLADSHDGLAARRPGKGGSGLLGVRQRTQSPSCRCDNVHQECKHSQQARLALGRAGCRCCCLQRTPPRHRRCQPVWTSLRRRRRPRPRSVAALTARTSPHQGRGLDIYVWNILCRPWLLRVPEEGDVNEDPRAPTAPQG